MENTSTKWEGSITGKSSPNSREIKNALIIMDISNLYYCIKKQYGDSRRLNYERFIANIGVNVGRAIAYGAEMENEASGFKSLLQRLGFETRYKKPKVFPSDQPGKESRKADWDVGMAMDVIRFANDFDVVIFGTADGDLAPCVEYIHEQYPHVECWVIACGISRELKVVADQWWEIKDEDIE